MQFDVPFKANNGVTWPSYAAYAEGARAALDDLEAVRDHGPLPPGVIPLVSVIKNERTLIEAFLAHYRALGVGRFLIVDNVSTDGTSEILAGAPDVSLWRTSASFHDANNGWMWMEGLLAAHARGRWAVIADADEFLVFAGMERERLPGLIRRLEGAGEQRLFAPMLDVYSDRPMREAVIAPGADPFAVCNWFDAGPEHRYQFPNYPVLRGGARMRVFYGHRPHGAPVLSKYPLVLYDEETIIHSTHGPTPFDRNFVRRKGRLLHVKLFAALFDRAQIAVREKQHWGGSQEYRFYLKVITENPDLNLHGPMSRKYEGPDSLIAAGMMLDVRQTAKP